MYGAMITAVQQRGFESIAVADVLALAGVSRRAFYEHFRDKEHCLLATHQTVVAQALRAAAAGWSTESTFVPRVHSSCKTLTDAGRSRPDQLHFLLVDSLASKGAPSRTISLDVAFVRPLRAALRAQPNYRTLMSATALVGAIRHAMVTQVLRHEALDPVLPHEVIDWFDCYRAPRGAPLENVQGLKIASRRPTPAQEPSDRATTRAIVALTLEQGYCSFSDGDVARAARISTKAFHSRHEDKGACLLAARGRLIELGVSAVRAEMTEAESWSQGVCCGVTALLAVLAADEKLTRVALLDFLEVGDRAVIELCDPVTRLAAVLAVGAPRPRIATSMTPELIAAAIWATVCLYAASGRLAALQEAVAKVALLALVPYLGVAESLTELALAGQKMRRGPRNNAVASSVAGANFPTPSQRRVGARSSSARDRRGSPETGVGAALSRGRRRRDPLAVESLGDE